MKTLKHTTINARNLQECQEHLMKVISSRAFLGNEGLNNEVPFHICPYETSIQKDITQLTKQLRNDLEGKQIKVLEINLYDLVIELLKHEGDWDWILENESTMSRERLREELQGILDVETVITPEIAQRMDADQYEVMLLTGIGEVFPYIRSHNVLNNLQKKAKDKPTLMFFPGEYQHSLESGASLVLFGNLQDDKYYRAFNILDRAV
ncbi:DUF1788 domain-containing protein [Marinomonas foliarum]|uniref:DUF1788 domain-containing protein n=1 Tax=Marinomonas foliarum TaxID=491950 RepID=A0ABX7IQ15_9GAMM|nr:DUF1788 domain-containing protein [Marinomonas foliarum]QRV23369.1 DUF1788 domain-containing protein [Marinomonas foliarum]